MRSSSVCRSASDSLPDTAFTIRSLSPETAKQMADERFEKTAAITGVGQSAVGRRLQRSAIDLTVEACRAALADAGLQPHDIDGLSTYPGGDALVSLGYGGPSTADVQDALRLNLQWYSGAAELPGQLGALGLACMAISAGVARHV